jgi:hypothetical protein
MTLGFAFVLVVACLFVVDRQQKRHDQSVQKLQATIDRLAERIQHPEVVLPDLDAKPSEAQLFVSPFDDEGFNALKADQ